MDKGFDDKLRKEHETGWLELLFVYFHRELTHGHFFRTAADNWSMYRRGGVFLSKGKPRFWNKPASNDKRLPLMDYHSVEARKVMERKEIVSGRLIVEHAVPISQLQKIIREHRPTSPKEIEEILCRLYRLGVVTYEEDRRLKKANMPSGWSRDSGSPYARYEDAGIAGSPGSHELA